MTDVHALARLQGVKGNTGKAMINHYTYFMLCMYVCMLKLVRLFIIV